MHWGTIAANLVALIALALGVWNRLSLSREGRDARAAVANLVTLAAGEPTPLPAEHDWSYANATVANGSDQPIKAVRVGWFHVPQIGDLRGQPITFYAINTDGDASNIPPGGRVTFSSNPVRPEAASSQPAATFTLGRHRWVLFDNGLYRAPSTRLGMWWLRRGKRALPSF